MSRFIVVFVLSAGLVMFLAPAASAAVVLRWDMDNPTPLDDSAGTNDLVPGAGAAAPTHLATGGVYGTGGYQFDGVNDFFTPTSTAVNLGPLASDWTASFWIQTTDAGTSSPYNGTPHVPVLTDASGGIGFGLGLHGGFAAYRHYNGAGPFGGWHHADGSINVADGLGHFVTFVYHGGVSQVDIYIDGVADTLGQTTGAGGFPNTFRHIGTSFGAQYAAFVLDSVQIVDRALTAGEILASFGPPAPPATPEPNSCVLLGLGAMTLIWRIRRRNGVKK